MATLNDPNNASNIAQVGAVSTATTQNPLHVVNRPIPQGAYGHYRISVVTGTLSAALAASAQVFQFKNTDASRLAVVTSIIAKFMPLTPFTAATLTDHTSFDAFIARNYASGGGGTTTTLTGNNAKMRTAHATPASIINVSQTAALTAATTLDANPFAQSLRKGNRVNPAAGTEEVLQDAFSWLGFKPDVASGESPLVLAQNEGFVIRNRTVWPVAGTGILSVQVAWAEVAAY